MDDAERRRLVDAWFRDDADRVLAYLLHHTDRHTAQDLVQEVFVVAFRKAPEVPDPPTGWLFGTARRLLANSNRGFRRRDRLVERLIDDASREPDREAAELKEAFATTLATLSARDREVLTLTGWYGLTPADAAVALGCSPNAYAVRLHRARTRLADALDAAGYRGGTPAARLAEALRG